jgi:hypothetical protein
MIEAILTLALPLLVIQVVLLLLLRPLLLWYLRIGHAVDALESIAESLEQMPAAKEYRTRVRQAGRKVA